MNDTEGAARAVLVVDDDATFRSRLVRAFEERGFAAHGAGGHDEAMSLAATVSPDLAVVDLRMPGKSGLDVVRDLKALDATTRVLVLTGYGSIATAIEAVRLGAEDYLTKPSDADQILGAFERVASKRTGAEPPPPGVAPSLARVEWEHIQRVLSDCEGNITKAARILGIHRRSLQRKLANYPPYR